MSTKLNYVVTYDSDISAYTGPFTTSMLLMTVGSNVVSAPINNLQFQRNIAPSEDNATLTVAGIQRIQAAREVYFYRVNSDGTLTLKFRGMTTNPHYHIGSDSLTTDVQINSLWYSLQTRLFQIAGKSPPPLQPNTNPYLVYLNPTLGLNFGQLWADIITLAYQNSYSTGHLPPLRLPNLDDYGVLNTDIPYFTDFDLVVVNDNMNLQYQSVSATVDRLVTSALFNASSSSPFLAEYRLDIGDLPINVARTEVTLDVGMGSNNINVVSLQGFSIGQSIYIGFGLGTQDTVTITHLLPLTNEILFTPPLAHNHFVGEIVVSATSLAYLYDTKLPTATVMLFDPVHSALGNGNNRTGTNIGDDTINSVAKADNDPTELDYPMPYVEFGVYNGFSPIDTIVFSEGDNMVVADLTYDYLSMNNSYVLTGGSFQGSDVVALPIDNQRSIAEFGLKQVNQPLQNVVDQGEISRFVGTSINFFQHPIPNIVIKPDYVYASTHTLYPGDYVLCNIPSLAGVLEDSNGNKLEGSYSSKPPYGKLTLAFTARIKTIDISWNPTDGEDITLTFTFPVQNVPIGAWNAVNNTQNQGSPGGAMQFMYTTVQPAAKTLLGRGRQAEGAATHQSGGDFITNRNNPASLRVTDANGVTDVIPDSATYDLQMFMTIVPNALNAIVNSPAPPSVATNITSVKGDDVLLYQFGVEVDAPSVSSTNVATANSVYLTVLQPDGMAIFDSVIGLNQLANILSLISKSHTTPSGTNSAPFMKDIKKNVNLSGKYQVILRNPNASSFMPEPIFATLAPPSLSVAAAAGIGPSAWGVIVVACSDAAGVTPIAMSFPGSVGSINVISSINVSWNTVSGAGSYNIYATDLLTSGIENMLAYKFMGFVVAPTISTTIGVVGVPGEPYPPFAQLSGEAATNTGSATLNNATNYWYAVTAVDAAGNESAVSAAGMWWKDGTPDTEPGTSAGHPTTTVNVDSGPSYPPANQLNVTDITDFASGQLVEVGASTVRDEYVMVTGVTSTVPPAGYLTLLTDLQFDHTAVDADDVTVIPQSIFVSWPTVLYAVSYNIYRGTVGSSYGDLTQIATGVTDTYFLDDGSSATTAIVTPVTSSVTSGNFPYVLYANYSFQSNPSQTSNITGQGNNPSTAIIYDPTQQRVYGPQPYVAP